MPFKQYYEAKTSPCGNRLTINVDGSLILPNFRPPKTGVEVPPSEQYITLMNSPSSEIDDVELLTKVLSKFPHEIAAQVYEFDCIEQSLVVKIKSSMVDSIHEFLLSEGCKQESFNPYITLYTGVNVTECKMLVNILNKIVALPSDVRLSGYKSEKINSVR